MSAPPRDRRPQYGWDRVTLFQGILLHEPASGMDTSVVVERPNGLYRVSVSGRVDLGASSGTGVFGYFVEGSNTGGAAVSEWLILGQTNLNELFSASAGQVQVRLLGLSRGQVTGEGFIGEAQLPIDRWKYIRVRTFVESEDPLDPVTFDMTIRMTGVGADGQLTENTSTLLRTSGDLVEPASDPIKKPEGVRYFSAQAFVDAMILDPVNDAGFGFNLLLEVAQNQNAVNNGQWATFDVLGPFLAAGESGFFANGQTRLVDLNGFQYFRFAAERVNPAAIIPPELSSFTIRCISVYDDADWIDGEQGIPLLNENLRKTFVQLVFGPVTGVAPNVEIKLQVCDMNQIPIRSARRVALLLVNSNDTVAASCGFSNDLNGAASIVSATAPASVVYGAGTNVAVVQTGTDGTAVIQVAAGGAVPLFVVGWNEWIPQPPAEGFFGPGAIVIASDRGQLT